MSVLILSSDIRSDLYDAREDRRRDEERRRDRDRDADHDDSGRERLQVCRRGTVALPVPMTYLSSKSDAELWSFDAHYGYGGGAAAAAEAGIHRSLLSGCRAKPKTSALEPNDFNAKPSDLTAKA